MSRLEEVDVRLNELRAQTSTQLDKKTQCEQELHLLSSNATADRDLLAQHPAKVEELQRNISTLSQELAGLTERTKAEEEFRAEVLAYARELRRNIKDLRKEIKQLSEASEIPPIALTRIAQCQGEIQAQCENLFKVIGERE